MGKVLIFNSDEKEDVLRRVGLARHFVTNLLSHLWYNKKKVCLCLNIKGKKRIGNAINCERNNAFETCRKNIFK